MWCDLVPPLCRLVLLYGGLGSRSWWSADVFSREGDVEIQRALVAGARDYVLKSTPLEELVRVTDPQGSTRAPDNP